jgi:hypothetical protein
LEPPNIQFYVPFRGEIREPLPQTLGDYWPWLSQHRGIAGGKYSWTLQTYLHLREAGVRCTLVRTFPSRGLVVAHRDFLPITMRPLADVFLVCIKPDRREHTWAHYYIVQNRSDPVFGRVGEGRAKALPYWPQPSLLPRGPERGTTCENVAYLGRSINLAEELRSPEWASSLGEHGLTWSIVPVQDWNDYRQIDICVAVRGFAGQAASADPIFNPNSKPPSKLINSWLAGVPAVVGEESAFRAIRTSPLDYLEVRTLDELTAAILSLKNDPGLYRRMVAHGRARAAEFSAAAVARCWHDMFLDEIVPAYAAWMRQSRMRRRYLNARSTAAFFANRQNLLGTRIHQR